MNVSEARNLARRWVEEEGRQIPGFVGAFHAGSTNFMEPDAEMPLTSDVDIFVVVDGGERKLIKTRYHGLILETSIHPADRFFRPIEEILSDFRYACHLALPSTIADPTGRLTEVQEAVAADYARREWVRKRCDMLYNRLVDDILADGWGATSLYPRDKFWAPAGRLHYGLLLAAQLPAVADLRAPTVRRSLIVSREVLAAVERSDIQESLLSCLGVAQVSLARTEAHLQALSQAFDAAVAVNQTPTFFGTMFDTDTRVIVIGGARQTIDMGLHREAMGWIHLLYDWAQEVLQNDAPAEEKASYARNHVQLLAQIDQGTPEACERRQAMLRDLAPEIMSVAETIMDQNPSIRD